MAKDLNDPPAETVDSADVAVRNGSSSTSDLEYGVPEGSLTDTSLSHTFFLHRGRPYVSPGRSARNHWQLIVVCTLLGVVLGAAFALYVHPRTPRSRRDRREDGPAQQSRVDPRSRRCRSESCGLLQPTRHHRRGAQRRRQAPRRLDRRKPVGVSDPPLTSRARRSLRQEQRRGSRGGEGGLGRVDHRGRHAERAAEQGDGQPPQAVPGRRPRRDRRPDQRQRPQTAARGTRPLVARRRRRSTISRQR